MTYKCKYFDIRELLPPSLGRSVAHDADHRFWWLFDDRLLRAIDDIREEFGPTYINTWSLSPTVQKAYGTRDESGLRIPGMKYYSILSQHSYGRAVDCVFEDVTGPEVQKFIVAHHRERFSDVRAMEIDVQHLHVDVRNTGPALVTFSPGRRANGSIM